MPISNLRYELLSAWAQVYEPSSTLFLADFRDVYFQADPFPRFREVLAAAGGAPALVAVEEARELSIGMRSSGNRWNTLWLHKCYGFDVVSALAGSSVFCSGTTAGNQRGVAAYLDMMLAELSWRRCRDVGGADQGVHNFLLRLFLVHPRHHDPRPRLPELAVLVEPQGRGAVNTLSALVRLRGALGDLGLRDARSGRVLNDDGTPSPVVHQWDRDTALKHWVRNEFAHMVAEA
mmetsp:Transcript_20098/g.60958  ORF Transcript_20098/g.60958 Transcript_20098/m.60958 type:complete len:234 (+) Transcript_20098:624-1325(+)